MIEFTHLLCVFQAQGQSDSNKKGQLLDKYF